MGATTFETTAAGADVNEAFAEAQRQARYEYGHAGYTGTIAEKGDYTVIQKEPVSLERAHEIRDKMIDDNDPRIDDKWGPAGALPLDSGEWYFFGWASC